ncbi:hypothetical protein NQ314_017934 [Rhamnusium bicolor]|uniref:Uncharacterized protein n=1 Tax=Rhamnusium bicolor TaxID=1586634 RepID=A0AAV8WS45_9CUCU|nr:hypothetical protein NQ314_017934 [Rhamnusium bicolor]
MLDVDTEGCIALFSAGFLTAAVGLTGGFTPLTLIISPVLPLGLGGGGCLLGSVGLSEGLGLLGFLAGGGVIGLGIRLGGEGGGRSRTGNGFGWGGNCCFNWLSHPLRRE